MAGGGGPVTRRPCPKARESRGGEQCRGQARSLHRQPPEQHGPGTGRDQQRGRHDHQQLVLGHVGGEQAAGGPGAGGDRAPGTARPGRAREQRSTAKRPAGRRGTRRRPIARQGRKMEPAKAGARQDEPGVERPGAGDTHRAAPPAVTARTRSRPAPRRGLAEDHEQEQQAPPPEAGHESDGCPYAPRPERSRTPERQQPPAAVSSAASGGDERRGQGRPVRALQRR